MLLPQGVRRVQALACPGIERYMCHECAHRASETVARIRDERIPKITGKLAEALKKVETLPE